MPNIFSSITTCSYLLFMPCPQCLQLFNYIIIYVFLLVRVSIYYRLCNPLPYACSSHVTNNRTPLFAVTNTMRTRISVMTLSRVVTPLLT